MGSKSPRGLPLMAVRPSENCTLIGKSSGFRRLRLSLSGVGSSSRPGVPGWMRRARKNSNPSSSGTEIVTMTWLSPGLSCLHVVPDDDGGEVPAGAGQAGATRGP